MANAPMEKYRLTSEFYRAKVAQIQAKLAEANLDGLLLLDPYNVMYASGFFHVPSERPLGMYIPQAGQASLYVPLLEQEHAAETWIRNIRVYFEFPGEEHPTLWMARETGAKRLGVDSVSYTMHGKLSAVTEIVVSPIVAEMRLIKSAEECKLVELAAGYADYCVNQVFEQAGAIIRGGGSELDVLSACLSATSAKMRAEVGDVFELYGGAVVGTVHSGPQAAFPHGRPNRRAPQVGETLIAGIGAKVYGYHAESGATFILSEPTAEQMHILKAMQACNDAAIRTLQIGHVGAAVNEAALGALRDAGLSAHIRHRIGHGIGVQGHEAPYLAPGDQTPLQAGMVFSNEPGVYRPGIDGYRTINTMIVTNGEAHIPSRWLATHPPETRVILLS